MQSFWSTLLDSTIYQGILSVALVVKNLPPNARDTGEVSSTLAGKKIPSKEESQKPTPVFLSEKFHGQEGAWEATVQAARVTTSERTHAIVCLPESVALLDWYCHMLLFSHPVVHPCDPMHHSML